MTKIIVGLLLGVLVGATCRWFDIPVPSPPSLLGALLVVAVTVGYAATDHALRARENALAAPVAAPGENALPTTLDGAVLAK